MRIVTLTSIGQSLAANPNNSGSDASKVLYFLRRSGLSASDEKLMAHFGFDKRTLNKIIETLVGANAISVYGGQ